MERIRALISKLKEQSEHQTNISGMMLTVQLIQGELAQLSSSEPQDRGTTKVAVVMPSSNKTSFIYKETVDEPLPAAPLEPAKKMAETVKEIENENSSPPNKQTGYQDKPRVELEPANKAGNRNDMPGESRRHDHSGWLFDPVQEIPTLAHQKEFKEMNDVFGDYGSSLNDRLKTERKEIAAVLNDGPVRDFKKAIGINDRFVFLSELFRGDDAMYERSIKTINNFRIFPEAEYWIERELKVKLGWDESKEAVKHFRQLVKRRFA
ncbi:MAG: hypothetical protein WKF89_07010 [Chitinophagaceae bacterium]